MLIELKTKAEKVALLEAVKTGVLDTAQVPTLQAVLDEKRPDLRIASMSDEELDQRIEELHAILNK